MKTQLLNDYTFYYKLVIIIDDKHALSIDMPHEGLNPVAVRAACYEAYFKGEENIPEFMRGMGKKFEFGINLKYRNTSISLEWPKMDELTRLKNQSWEYQLLVNEGHSVPAKQALEKTKALNFVVVDHNHKHAKSVYPYRQELETVEAPSKKSLLQKLIK